MLTGFIFGMCLMSLSAIIAAQMLEDGKDWWGTLFLGPVAWAWFIVGSTVYRIHRRLKLHYFRKHYTSILLMCEGKSYDKYYVRNELVKVFYTKEENPNYYAKVFTPCCNFYSFPPRGYMLDKQQIRIWEKDCFLRNFIHTEGGGK